LNGTGRQWLNGADNYGITLEARLKPPCGFYEVLASNLSYRSSTIDWSAWYQLNPRICQVAQVIVVSWMNWLMRGIC